ncbi:MAG: DUF1572 domain-containing protein [Spirochaeta sp.]|nr:DUF1572 domain-containing protein [Spirochaeta sp.]
MTGIQVLDYLKIFFDRELTTFIDEFKKIPEDKLWQTTGTIANSGAVLAKHIAGNLNHFFGHVLGRNSYIREREKEFNPQADKSRDELVADLEACPLLVQRIISSMTEEELSQPFPVEVLGGMNTLEFLLQLYHHLSYHLGQLNYLRRALSSS